LPFFLIRLRLFRELLHKSAHTPKELLAVTAIFSLFALFSTWSGVPVEGSLVNVRIIAVMSGGSCLALGGSYCRGDCRRTSLPD
jgi:two-component system LytT family sensor kinase